jgi:hypothetical protein
MRDKYKFLNLRLICCFEGGTIVLIIWMIYYIFPVSFISIYYYLMVGFGFQASTLLIQIIFGYKKLMLKSSRIGWILYAIIGTIILTSILLLLFSIIFDFKLISEPIDYIILSIFIILFGIDRILTQNNKKVYKTNYRIWVVLESMISIILGGVSLFSSIFRFMNVLLLILICLGLAASSNIFLAINGIKPINN